MSLLNLQTKQSVQSIPFGETILNIHIVYWDKDREELRENPQVLADGIIEQINPLLVRIGEICNFQILRLISITDDMDQAVRYWQRELGEYENGVSSSDTFGKVFCWGSGEQNSSYAIIVLDEGFVSAMFASDENIYNLAVKILAHELGHVEDDWKRLAFRAEDTGSWVHFISESCWSEFAASSVENKILNSLTEVDEAYEFSCEVLIQRHELAQEAIREFSKNEDIDALFQVVTQSLSVIFNQLGRSLGGLVNDEEKSHYTLFLNRVRHMSPLWSDVIEHLSDQLEILKQGEWNQEKSMFIALQSIIEDKALPALGIHTTITPTGTVFKAIGSALNY